MFLNNFLSEDSCEGMSTTTWHPSEIFLRKPQRPYAVIILNQPVNKNALKAIFESALMIVCADAGADRLLALETDSSVPIRLPDVIIGDLDSISKEAEQHYRHKGVSIEKDPDQYSTDFTKALKWIRKQIDIQGRFKALDVVVLSGLGGRVDQGFSQIHHLYMAESNDQLLRGRIYLVSEQSLTFILDAGENEILIEPNTFEENVGIIPVMGPTRISIKGFEWDVEDWLTEFGGQVSTSNHLRSEKIWVKVDGPKPLMTLELAKHLCMVL